MMHLSLLLSVAIIEHVYGRHPLTPLQMTGGCDQVEGEVEVFRVEGDAVILAFPMFERVLELRNIAPLTANYLITKSNGTEAVTFQNEGRVQQHNQQLWLLPAQPSDSGEYKCTYRNGNDCVTGSITLHVYKSSSVDMDIWSYRMSGTVGNKLTLRCPSLGYFNKTDRLIEWYKNETPTPLRLTKGGSFHQDKRGLMILSVEPSHAGFYTCQLSVLIRNNLYNVSRAILLGVQGSKPRITTKAPNAFVTPGPDLISSSTYSTVEGPIIKPPLIVSPLNGTIFEFPHGSGSILFCTVLTECQTAESTVVTWLVNGQSAKSAHHEDSILQGPRKVTRVHKGCQIELGLAVVAMTEKHVMTELKCVTENQGGRQEVVIQLQLEDSSFTWLVVAVVAVSCFLVVVSVFLSVLFKPRRKKKMDYILARQNSTF
ncbi:hypothetical protein Q5P01_013870 [Channa striata]|uniref:Ig-like domain-containing protein n=1 Tax=Channa striata TaxID=64152 RepID=A0AA88MN66_CHASR|nr:hypothetical protein Q5P01_013870 [Channa striata]